MGFFDKLIKKHSDSAPVKKEKLETTVLLPETQKERTEPTKQIESIVTIKQEQVKREQIRKLSYIDLGQPVGAFGCFLNYSIYKVTGKDEQGNRRLKIRTGINEQKAIEKAMNEGVLGPYTTVVKEHDIPTERQLECLKSHGIFIPEGITKDDASYMISRLADNDLESPAAWLVALANGLGTEYSAFIGNKSLFNSVIYQAGDRDRAALFGYAVRQNLQGSKFGNMLEDADAGLFYDFADQVILDAALMRSLSGRKPTDYIQPNKGTAIYKAAVARFSGGGT